MCSAGREKNAQGDPPREGALGAWEIRQDGEARIHVIQEGGAPGGRVLREQGARGIMIHPTLQRGAGRFSRRAGGCRRWGLVERPHRTLRLGPPRSCMAASRRPPPCHEPWRGSACPLTEGHSMICVTSMTQLRGLAQKLLLGPRSTLHQALAGWAGGGAGGGGVQIWTSSRSWDRRAARARS